MGERAGIVPDVQRVFGRVFSRRVRVGRYVGVGEGGAGCLPSATFKNTRFIGSRGEKILSYFSPLSKSH